MDILNAADWSNEDTFQQFYHWEIRDGSMFRTLVLSSADTSSLRVDNLDMKTEPSKMLFANGSGHEVPAYYL